MRSRRVSDTVLFGLLDLPVPPLAVIADWKRETSLQLALEPGDVEVMPLARTRARWPGYARCVQAMAAWTKSLGLASVLDDCEVALMACRGAYYHHDGAQYGGMAFCNLFLSEDKGLDVHFPASGHRAALTRGTAMMFDTCQPHGVIPRASTGFQADDFIDDQDHTQLFLSWELPIDNPRVARALGIDFDVVVPHALAHEAQLMRNGARARVCAASGQWCQDSGAETQDRRTI